MWKQFLIAAVLSHIALLLTVRTRIWGTVVFSCLSTKHKTLPLAKRVRHCVVAPHGSQHGSYSGTTTAAAQELLSKTVTASKEEIWRLTGIRGAL